VRFRILGPLEVTVDDVQVTLGGPKPRALLAALLLNPGTVVPTDRLVAAVWGDDPPRDALGTLRAYVSRLRTVLAPLEDGERLRYRPPGYVLSLADGELDAVQFAGLVDEARAHAAASDHARAVELLDLALALWRGEVLGEFDRSALDADADVARLAELWLVAAEERAESMLQLGRAREVVPDLEALVRRHPVRERPATLLMRALYAAGRQSDALTVYRDLRSLLVEELGVEPSEPTRTVHRRLLEQDPTLLPGVPATITAGNLPRRRSSFVGRVDELAHVTDALRESPVVTLTGVGGAGKSRLAMEAATAERSRFPDGAWLCELAPLPDGGPVGEAVAAALNVRQRHGLTIDETVIEFLRSRTLLILLDNCEHVLEAAARLVDQVVTQCPGVVVLATSREPLAVPGEQVWPVPALSAPDAITLFVQRARATRPDFRPDAGTEQTVAAICRRLDGLPLAIELAAARIRAMSTAEVAQRLDDGRLLAAGSRTAQPRHQSLAAAIDWSYRLLSEPEQRLFVRLSVFAGGADLTAVHAVCADAGTTESDTLDLVTALVDKSMVVLLDSSSGSRYRLLETMRAYGRERLTDAPELSRRHAGHYAELAQRAARGVQGPDEQAWVDRTHPDADNIRAAFERAMTDGDADLALRVVTSLPEVLQVRLGYEAARWAERALELTRPDHPLFVAGVGAAARGAWNLGDFARARRLAALAEGRSPGRGTARSGYPADVAADVALYEGDVDRALAHYEAQVEVARRDDDPIRLVWTLYYVAICHAVRREPERGLEAGRESVRLADGTANPTAMSMSRYALGLLLKKCEPAQALELLDEAAALAAGVRNLWWQSIAMMEAGSTRAVHGDPAVAARELVAVLDHWDRVGDWTQQWLNLRYVVRLLVRLGCDEEALTLHHCLLVRGKPSPLDAARAGQLLDGAAGPRSAAADAAGRRLSEVDAVVLARSALLHSILP
jgi:predicted ATPase/DNA-binding SARP family transcriptional activator